MVDLLPVAAQSGTHRIANRFICRSVRPRQSPLLVGIDTGLYSLVMIRGSLERGSSANYTSVALQREVELYPLDEDGSAVHKQKLNVFPPRRA